MSIKYISGGLLGDFIHQLSIINEIYIQTNKKGILYIANIGDQFRNGLEKTYNDLYEIVSIQEYIQEFKIYNGESYDYNLSEWRNYNGNHSNLIYVFKVLYNIEWGKHKWLSNIPKKPEWENKIIINTVHYRFPDIEFFDSLKNIDLSNYIFVSCFKNEYHEFINKTNILIDYYSPSSLFELCIILNSCKQVIGSLSAVLSISTALYTDCGYGLNKYIDMFYFYNLDSIPCIKYKI